MKLSQAKEYLPLVQAAAEGKTIQIQAVADECHGEPTQDCDWVDEWFDLTQDEQVHFSHEAKRYRIKPEPKLRPWNPEEVPVGAIAKLSGCDDSQRFLINYVCGYKISVGVEDNASPQSLLKLYVHSTDGGKTWKPCGVEE